MPPVKIRYNTAQDISNEILGGAIQFCRETGYKQNAMMLTFFWSAFLLSAKNELDENGILDKTLNCFSYSLGKVMPQLSENAQSIDNIHDMCQHYWKQLSTDFNSLRTETEILSLIKIADELNFQGDSATAYQLKKDPAKTFSQISSNISSSIYRLLRDIDNGICIQYKYVLDEFQFQYARGSQSRQTNTTEAPQETPVYAPSATNEVNEPPLGMSWYKFLIYFGLFAAAVINIMYGFCYMSGGIYFAQSNGDISAELVYGYYGAGLRVLDVVYGFFLVAFAILAIVVRQKLAHYEPDSLKFIKIYYSLSCGAPFLYAILLFGITGLSLDVQDVILVLGSGGILFWNIKYFEKRAHLFVENAYSEPPSPVVQSQAHQQGFQTNEVPFSTESAVTKESTRFCRICGTKLHVDSVFCHKCGTKTID